MLIFYYFVLHIEYDIIFPTNQTHGIRLDQENPLLLTQFTISARVQCLGLCRGTLLQFEGMDQVLFSVEFGESIRVLING